MRFLLVALLMALPARASSQAVQTELAVSGFTGNFGTATAADFDQGFRASPQTTAFTVTITGHNRQRVTTVQVSTGAGTFGPGKPISDVQWSLDQLAWNGLTSMWAVVDTRTIQTQGTSWGGQIHFRTLLQWTADPAATLTAPVSLRLVIVAP